MDTFRIKSCHSKDKSLEEHMTYLERERLGIRLGTYSRSQYDSVAKCENPNSDTQPQTQLGTSRITTSSRILTQVTPEILATQQGQVRFLTTHKNHSSVQTPHRGHNSSSMSTHKVTTQNKRLSRVID